MRIVAISGKAASGKDTVAAMLARRVAGAVVLPFAAALKRVACELWDVKPEDIALYEVKARMRPRLISLGSLLREIDPDVWVNLVIRQARASMAPLVLIPDLRFVNEWRRLVSEFGGDTDLVRLRAPVAARRERMGSARFEEYVAGDMDLDPSETQMDFLEDTRAGRLPDNLAPWADVLRAHAHVVDNDEDLAALEERCAAWFARAQVAPSERVLEALYRVSRRVGPEARLSL